MSQRKDSLLHILYRLPVSTRRTIYNIYDYFYYPELRETRKTYGELNKDKTFYVIRPFRNTNEGLMSLLLNVCRQLLYAEGKNYIPVVDFKNYATQYHDDRNVNIWEDYFEQPAGYGLDEVYKSKHVILSGLKPVREEYFEPSVRFNEQEVFLARRIMRKYIRINKDVLKLLEEERVRISPRSCVGVYLRGTDYLTVKPVGHSIQPAVEQVAPLIDALLDERKLQKVFLVTEDNSIYEAMAGRYAEKLSIVSFDRFISDYQGDGYLYQSAKIDQLASSKHERGLYYLVKELLLSECSCIVVGNTCGSWAAVAFSDTDHFKIMDLGRY